jgi:hypothetical protein
MRHESSFLRDILSACQKIEAIVARTSEALFLKDEVSPAAVLHHLTVIGESLRCGTGSCMPTSTWTGRSSGTRPSTTFPNLGGRL